MFVDIEHLKSPLAVENLLSPYKKGRVAADKRSHEPKEKITPEVCAEVLKSTNYARNIKDMLLCVKDLPEAEQLACKDMVLAAFTQREQPADIVVEGKKLAEVGGYENALNNVLGRREGEFLISAPFVWRGFATYDNYFNDVDFKKYTRVVYWGQKSPCIEDVAEMPVELQFPNCSRIVFRDCSFEHLKKIKIQNQAEVFVRNPRNCSSELDFSDCAKLWVNVTDVRLLQNWKYNPEKLCFHLLSAREKGELNLEPFAEVDLHSTSLHNIAAFRFRNGTAVNMDNASGFKCPLDFSPCAVVNLNGCDLHGAPSLKFAQGAKVFLLGACNMPVDTNFQNCAELDLTEAILPFNLEKLTFAPQADVILDGTFNLPPYIDFSTCAKLTVQNCDFSQVQEIVCRDEAQRQLLDLPKNWNGKISFSPQNAAAEPLYRASDEPQQLMQKTPPSVKFLGQEENPRFLAKWRKRGFSR